MRDLPAPVYVSSVRARGLRPRRGGTTLAMTTCSVLPSVPYDAVGPPNSIFLSRLNTQPTRCPVNASPLPSRTATHDSGPTWFAIPWLGGTCTRETYRFVPAHRIVKKSPKRWMFVTLQRRLWYGIRGRKEKEYRAMTSNDEKKSTIPYAPYSTFSTALDYLASHGLPTKLDRSMLPWCITLDNSKGISRLRFWCKNSRVNGINDLPVFMHQGSEVTAPQPSRLFHRHLGWRAPGPGAGRWPGHGRHGGRWINAVQNAWTWLARQS